ncbi:hypothetical protein DID88_002960 [Monilinia fructigena]|uniref:Uncharacterized protein n=1 Tax=Monilinia fructigena TaxID=38457 RepID=A0A395IP71_9HELO|nr:hypothetical protein DID88_002960 [Monilinia fructigena]
MAITSLTQHWDTICSTRYSGTKRGAPVKRQKITDFEKEDFENKLTAPIALELGEESRDLELKLLDKSKYGHVAFVPHDAHQDDECDPGGNARISLTLRGLLEDNLQWRPQTTYLCRLKFKMISHATSELEEENGSDELRKELARIFENHGKGRGGLRRTGSPGEELNKI